jgi:hypothetical protein
MISAPASEARGANSESKLSAGSLRMAVLQRPYLAGPLLSSLLLFWAGPGSQRDISCWEAPWGGVYRNLALARGSMSLAGRNSRLVQQPFPPLDEHLTALMGVALPRRPA